MTADVIKSFNISEVVRGTISETANFLDQDETRYEYPTKQAMFKYARAFGGQDPILSEESVFRVTVMLPHAAGTLPALTGQATGSTSQPESQPESRPESQPESLEIRVLRCLQAGAASKATLSSALGQKSVSGPLNQAVRQLLAAGLIEYTQPDKPNSRLQKYRLTPAGQARLNQQDPSL